MHYALNAIDNHVVNRSGWLVVAIFFSGIFSGITRNIHDKKKAINLDSIFMGILASIMCPLFLKTISSDLLTKFLDDKNTNVAHEGFLLVSFFTLTAFYSKNFVNTIKEKFLTELEKVKDQQEEISSQTFRHLYVTLSVNTKQFLHNLLLSNNESFTSSSLQSETSLTDGEYQEAVEELLDKKILIKTSSGKFKIDKQIEFKKLDEELGPEYD